MAIKSIAHICINTTDLAATANFYCGALGFTHVFDFVRKGRVVGFYLKTANTTFLEAFQHGEVLPIERNRNVLSHLCLECDDLRALHASLLARGLKPGPVIMGGDNALQFWIDDPNGMAVEFQEYSTDSSQLTGKPVEVTW